MPIEFQNEAQKATYDMVAAALKEEFGRQAFPDPDQPHFALLKGSARITVTVTPRGDSASVLRAFSWVVTGPERSPELHKYLLEQNLNFVLGAFGIDSDGDVLFTYAVPGEGLSAAQVLFAVYAVLGTADDYDDDIMSKFGGQRALDRG